MSRYWLDTALLAIDLVRTREERGHTLRDAQAVCGVHRSTLWRLETGSSHTVSADTFLAVLAYLGTNDVGPYVVTGSPWWTAD